MQVQELRPCSAVSIIDTDVEADVVPSMEAEEYLARWERERQEQQARLEALAAARAEREATEAAAAAAEAARAAEAAAAAAARREELRRALESQLPPEPAAGSDPRQVVTCAFTLPDGSRVVRRFGAGERVQVLFDFVDSRGAGGWERGSYQLVTRMPRRVVVPEGAGEGRGSGRVLGDVGLQGGGSEAFLLEALQPPAAEGAAAMEVDAGAGTEGVATA